MSTAPKKDNKLNKHSFRGLTPDQLNELTQEQVVELFRARIRRRFSRSRSSFIQKSSISIFVFMPNARKARRPALPDKNQLQSRLTFVMLSSYPRWLEITWLFIMVNPLITFKSNSIWLADIQENSLSHTSLASMVRPVSVPPKVQLILHSNDHVSYSTLHNTLSLYGILYLHLAYLYYLGCIGR